MSDIGVRSIWIGSTALITAFHHQLLPGSYYPEFYQNSKKLVNTSSPYAHPQHIKLVKHLSYVWHWCEINLDWVYSLNHCISPSYVLPGQYPEFYQNSKSLVNMSSRNVVRTHPYAHPQHMKVVKLLAYVWHWCEINLGWVYSLNHRISPSVIAWKLPRILPKSQKLGQHEQP